MKLVDLVGKLGLLGGILTVTDLASLEGGFECGTVGSEATEVSTVLRPATENFHNL